jgi:excisionase family DNA binding protein
MLTVAEAARRLGLSTTAIYDLCSRSEPRLRHYRIGIKGATVRIPEEAIGEYLERSLVEPAPIRRLPEPASQPILMRRTK